MPKVLGIGHWRVAIYPNDHRPAHVHVISGGGEADGLAKALTHLCAKWSEQHGGY